MSTQLLTILGASWLAGLAAFIGASIARFERSADSVVKREIIHGVVAFGGGILVAAVAFALLPHGMSELSVLSVGLLFCLGGVVFMALDAWITRQAGSVAQFMAMLLDFVPEAISMGAVFARDRKLGLLLAMFIAAQNFPEGFNSYREIVKNGEKSRRALVAILGVSLLGPLAALLGYLFLRESHAVTGGIMVFAAGGILYLIFQDIAPQAKMRWHWLPPIGAVLGFAFGLIGKMLID